MTVLHSIRRNLSRFARATGAQRALLLGAVWNLVYFRFALLVVPFPRLMQRAGIFVPPQDERALCAARPGEQREADIARQVGWAVTRAARHVPFKAVCLPQALAARAMLRRRGIASAMHFAAARGTGKPLEAHAWLDAAGVEVTGYPIADRYAEVACIV